MHVNYNEATASRRRIPVYLVDSSGVLVTGAVPSGAQIQVSLSGGTWANGAGTWTEDAAGVYYYEAARSETVTDSFLLLRIAATGARIVVFSVDLGERVALNEATSSARRLPIYLVDASGTPVTSLTISGTDCQISKSGATFANGAGAVTEIGGAGAGLGAYYYEATLGEVDTAGYGLLKIDKSPSALPYIYEWNVVDAASAFSPPPPPPPPPPPTGTNVAAYARMMTALLPPGKVWRL